MSNPINLLGGLLINLKFRPLAHPKSKEIPLKVYFLFFKWSRKKTRGRHGFFRFKW